jgi:hypothetical protein
VVAYGCLLLAMSVFADLSATLQLASRKLLAHRAVTAAAAGCATFFGTVLSPFSFVASAAGKAVSALASAFGWVWCKLRMVLGYLPVIGRWVGSGASSSEEHKSGDDLREEFRNRRKSGSGGSASLVSSSSSSSSNNNKTGLLDLLLSPSEQKLGLALFLLWLGLHVKWGEPSKPLLEAATAPWGAPSSLSLRGLLSKDVSFAQELAIATAFAAAACAFLLLSFLLVPSKDPQLAKYHLLLWLTYAAPLTFLCWGSVLHAWTCLLSRPASAAGLAYSSAANLTFDGVCDCFLVLCCAAHLFLARFRRLPLPEPLRGASELWEELELDTTSAASTTTTSTATATGATPPASSSSSMVVVVRRPLDHAALPNAPLLAKLPLPSGLGRDWATGTNNGIDDDGNGGGGGGGQEGGDGSVVDASELVVVAGSGVGGADVVWRRRYNWRTGLTHYEQEGGRGELRYPDGGPKAVFEETELDTCELLCEGVSLHDPVSVGCCFVVVSEGKLGSGSAEAFGELWGHAFARTVQERADNAAKRSNNGGSSGRFSGRGGGSGGGAAGRASGGSSGLSAPSVVAERVVGEALERSDFYFVLGVYAAATLVGVAGTLAGLAYHALTALGAVGGLFACRHLAHPPQRT